MSELRVIDFGLVSALRSQSIWHALASSVGHGAPVTLSFMRPESSYVGIGMHRSIEEVDRRYCQRESLPIFRRQVGGGPVFLDKDQLFFQVSSSPENLPVSRPGAIDYLLRPFGAAFKAAGVNAELDAKGEFCVDGAKVCGHGAGEIDGGVVVVGNLIERFNHTQAAAIMNIESSMVKAEIESMMRRFVGSFSGRVDSEAFKTEARRSLAHAMDLVDVEGELTENEWSLVDQFDELLSDDAWTEAPEFMPPVLRPMRIVKIRAGVYVVFRIEANQSFLMSVVFGKVETLSLDLAIGDEKMTHSNGGDMTGNHISEVVSRLVDRGYLIDMDVSALLNAGVITREVVSQ